MEPLGTAKTPNRKYRTKEEVAKLKQSVLEMALKDIPPVQIAKELSVTTIYTYSIFLDRGDPVL